MFTASFSGATDDLMPIGSSHGGSFNSGPRFSQEKIIAALKQAEAGVKVAELVRRHGHVLTFEGWPTLLAGGQERSLYEVVGRLRESGVVVTLAYEREGPLLAEYRAMGVKVVKISTRVLVVRSRFAIRNLCAALGTIATILWERWLSEEPWTLIYVNQYSDLSLANLLRPILRLPTVCHLRVPAPARLSRQYCWGLRRCRLLICNSYFTAESYIRRGMPADRIVVVHNGIDIKRYSPAPDGERSRAQGKGTRRILYVGRIVPDKGIEVLVDAVALLRGSGISANLTICGPTHGHRDAAHYLQFLKSHAERALGGAVTFLDAVANVVPLYRDADLVVLPAMWEEAFGRVVIEAMACGTPCVASRVGGIPEILRNELACLMFERGNAAELANRLDRYGNWREDFPLLGDECRRRVVDEFAAEGMHAKMIKLLDAVQSGSEVELAGMSYANQRDTG